MLRPMDWLRFIELIAMLRLSDQEIGNGTISGNGAQIFYEQVPPASPSATPKRVLFFQTLLVPVRDNATVEEEVLIKCILS